MSLKRKLSLFVILFFSFLISSTYFLYEFNLKEKALLFDIEAASNNLQRAKEALLTQLTSMEKIAFDWGAWNDTYEFIEDRNKEYILDNYNDTAFHDNEWNLVYIVDKKNNVVWTKSLELNNNQRLIFNNFIEGLENAKTRILTDEAAKFARSGIYMTELGPMLLASSPILKSDYSGPHRGTLILGKLIDQELIENISGIIRTKINIWPNTEELISSKYSSHLRYLRETKLDTLREITDNSANIYSSLDDIFNIPSLLISINTNESHKYVVREFLHDLFKILLVLAAFTFIFVMLFYRYSIYNQVDEVLEISDAIAKDISFKEKINFSGNLEFLYIVKSLEYIAQEHQKQIDNLTKNSYDTAIKNISTIIVNDANSATAESLSLISKVENHINILPVIDLERVSAELLSGKIPDHRMADLIKIISNSSKCLREQQSKLQIALSEIKRTIHSIVNKVRRHTTNYSN